MVKFQIIRTHNSTIFTFAVQYYVQRSYHYRPFTFHEEVRGDIWTDVLSGKTSLSIAYSPALGSFGSLSKSDNYRGSLKLVSLWLRNHWCLELELTTPLAASLHWVHHGCGNENHSCTGVVGSNAEEQEDIGCTYTSLPTWTLIIEKTLGWGHSFKLRNKSGEGFPLKFCIL